MADPETCCICGSADIGYRNYRDQPFCQPCADPEAGKTLPVRRTVTHALQIRRPDHPWEDAGPAASDTSVDDLRIHLLTDMDLPAGTDARLVRIETTTTATITASTEETTR